MISIPLTDARLQGYEQALIARGCYAQPTIDTKIRRARQIRKELGAIPPDEDMAIQAVDRIERLTPRMRLELRGSARDLVEYLRRSRHER